MDTKTNEQQFEDEFELIELGSVSEETKGYIGGPKEFPGAVNSLGE
jgi:hypothetical protein